MPYTLYDYVNANGINQIQPWVDALQPPQRAKLNEMLDKLQMHGETLRPQMLTGTDVAGISKLRIHGKVQLRPLLCCGPVNVKTEFTLLCGAKEVGGKLVPKDADKTADLRKQEVQANPAKRRILNERCKKPTD